MIDPIAALIVEDPAATPLATPPLAIVPMEEADELQVTALVRFCVLPSLYVPIAMNGCVCPTAIVGFPGVTAIDIKVAAEVTPNVVAPVIDPELALIVVAP